MAKKSDATLNFRFRSNNQSKDFGNEEIRTFSDSYARIVVNQILISASDKAFQSAKSNLTKNVRAAVGREIAQLAFMVSRFLVQPHNATGPRGTITSLEANTSNQARANRWITNRFQLEKSGVHWRKRSFNYLMWKGKKYGQEDWWTLKGSLQRSVSKSSFYTENFGPISVQFVRNTELSKSGRSVDSQGNLIDSLKGKNITQTGRGRTSATAHVGTIIVSVMGKISASMLPALASGSPEGGATPTGSARLTSLIGDSDVRNKLTGRGEYRPVLEPFLAYYLTRAIPNTVYRQVEKLVDVSAGSNFLQPKSGSSLAAFSGGGAG